VSDAAPQFETRQIRTGRLKLVIRPLLRPGIIAVACYSIGATRVMRSWVLKGQRWRENDRLIDKHSVVLRAKILVMPGFARG
jgi:hypothetical protein